MISGFFELPYTLLLSLELVNLPIMSRVFLGVSYLPTLCDLEMSSLNFVVRVDDI